ncbi:helix-turn-helix domain-containing protein [Mucilaginibacter phyllosphaerae]|uniref:AraC family transcriptional regulator n=1 Tax=Mucilaginibacter phyllosphaerae TaxID=1812349 RepID=A0A4Y8A9E8_9SPHI|nr:AraC family transcriptional regulator [Mucilaginibacter phyllosphaerae]MBB3970499.1 AraC-like DNA-binding protein [Mucilaginibacter phyllosphaerae]TEW64514.1 AraC family transcriptional regulator [Mucilaginibacter phyllosphaerae]GGH19160.1 AraC family transcriptional regulator [Mucilaginibacter phyllosphaerae]
MNNLLRFDTIGEYNIFNNTETKHPLVTVVDFSKANPRQYFMANFGFYAIFLKEVKCGDLIYGKNTYDYQEGTLVFVAPGQIAGANSKEIYQPKGYGLMFHPDLIHGTSLGRFIKEYTFFGYQSKEALHLSERERSIVLDCFTKIDYELERGIDKHSKRIIISNIELFLDYCTRFYDRQFITRNHVYQGVIERFENLLNEYFESEKSQTIGLPTVAYCAEELNLSANYFGDLVKKETGKSASEYIQFKLIDVAKERIFNLDKNVSQIAYELGFKYPQHFARLFKQKVGYSPLEYRSMN